ncbi:MAG TPA: hypothetical protein VGI04_02430 [Neobacillus sp.]
MDKAIILNVFDFVSFHVCKTLLERGIEVKGIQVDDCEKGSFADEKKLEVGRNANFEEQSLVTWANKDKRELANTTIIISLYDIFMLFKEPLLQNETIVSHILKVMERSDDVVSIILPCQMLESPENSSAIMEFHIFLDQALGLRKNLQLLFLPTVYGPWQPETFLFQQSLLTKINRNQESKGIREETMDAIYIDDAIDLMIDIIETGKPGRYLLESGREKQWDRCAAYLNLGEKIVKVDQGEHDYSNINRISVKNVTSIEESLAKQTEHTLRLYSSY